MDTTHNEIRESIRPLVPTRMLARPVDHRGYPVPWFVTLRDAEGRYEFRVLDRERYAEAIKKRVCWICGERLGRYVAFAVGPMCGITRTSGEPPQHLECAVFSVRACPFMLLPKAHRRTATLPPDAKMHEAGLPRNPGVSLVWSTQGWSVLPTEGGRSVVFRMGAPLGVSFWKEGRGATRAEIDESISGGLPALTESAAQDGEEGLQLLTRMTSAFQQMLPAA